MTAINDIKLAALVVGVALLSGCGILKKKTPEPVASASSVPLTVPAPPPVTPPPVVDIPVAVADHVVPAPEDFEDEAFEKVTDKTYKTELAALKKEVEAK